MGAYRPRNVLDLLFPHILEREIELVAHLIAHDAADAYSARRGQRFKACRDIDAITVNIRVVDDDVADVQADAKFDAPLLRDGDVAFGHEALDVDGTAYRIDDTGELDEDAVARGLDDAPPMLRDFRVDYRPPVAFQGSQSAFLVNTHQARIAGDVRGQNRGQPSLNPILAHHRSLKLTSA